MQDAPGSGPPNDALRWGTMKSKSRKIDTLLTHAGRDSENNFGAVNPPVYHASTILYPTVKSMEERQKVRFAPGVSTYGRHGTPTTFALKDPVPPVEPAFRPPALPSPP